LIDRPVGRPVALNLNDPVPPLVASCSDTLRFVFEIIWWDGATIERPPVGVCGLPFTGVCGPPPEGFRGEASSLTVHVNVFEAVNVPSATVTITA
jgi:hypothetical protein